MIKNEATLAENRKILEKQSIQLTRIEEKLVNNVDDKLKDLNRYLKGNGQPGLLDRVTKVEGRFVMMWAIVMLILVAIVTASLTKFL